MAKIEAVVFDMDGLMFETEKLWLDAVVKTNEEYNYNVPPSLIIECMGKRKPVIDKILKEHMGEDFDPDEFRRLNRIFMNEDIIKNGLKIKKGLIELITFLKSKNIKIAVASNSTYDRINDRFKQANLDINLFDNVIGGDMITESKPSPQIYLKSCEILGVEPKNALALEDSESGIMSAHSAGMMPILIPDLKMPSDEVLKLAHRKFEDLSEVISLFDGMEYK